MWTSRAEKSRYVTVNDQAPPESAVYYDHAMLLAQVLIELYAHDDALSVLDDLRVWYAGAEQ